MTEEITIKISDKDMKELSEMIITQFHLSEACDYLAKNELNHSQVCEISDVLKNRIISNIGNRFFQQMKTGIVEKL